MNITRELLERIRHEYGSSFYILDVEQFGQNFDELNNTFNKYYPNTRISYSYKTNYTPRLCRTVLEKGGYAEIVSDMEYKIALKVGVPKNKVIFNGPWKEKEAVRDILLNDGIVNIDSAYDFQIVKDIADQSDHAVKIGLRINFDIHDGVTSRFGFDICDAVFKKVFEEIKNHPYLCLAGIHLHFASRNIKHWPDRAKGLIQLLNELDMKLEYFSLGGGIFGKMDESLKKQFSEEIPTYEDYAKAVCPILNDYFKAKGYLPRMYIEPGSALVGDCMKFVAPVVSIKQVRNQTIATLRGSIYNINPTLNTKNPPVEVFHMNGNDVSDYTDVNFGGFTCIESDYLYKGYNGKLAVNDLIMFGNVGSYSVVLKPPFILPNFPIVSVEDGDVHLVKRKETFDDLFQTYEF
jgi:diaminopimelate decarboxylase